MILMYHHIGRSDDENFVSEEKFLRDIAALRNREFVHLRDYNMHDPYHVVITFDDAYSDILQFAVPLLAKRRIPFDVFVIESYFRKAESGAKFSLDSKGLMEVMEQGGRLQYHSKDHSDLSSVHDELAIQSQIRAPEDLVALDRDGFEFFAYPFGRYNDRVIQSVADVYKGAVSCKGLGRPGNIFALDRIKVIESYSFDGSNDAR
jgi:peptidoglycan/xylan/chitin deacetylase (PgdA/CDA1 family)